MDITASNQPRRRGRPLRRRTSLLALACFAAACSGGDEPQATAPLDEAPTTSEATDEPATTTTGAVPTTTTTEPPPSILGERWVAQRVLDDTTGVGSFDLIETDAALWMLGNRFNGTIVYRSVDDGLSWEEVVISPPPANGGTRLTGLTVGSDGRHVAWGFDASDCGASEPAPQAEGFRLTQTCRALRPVLFLSDDSGETFRRIAPPALQPPSGASLRLGSVIATDNGYLAVGTVRSTDWHGRVWTSPDAETWTLAAELRGADGPISGVQVVESADQVIVLGTEHPCSEPAFNSGGGWILGTTSGSHARLFSGPAADQLALLTADTHPLAPAPAVIDCEVQDQFEINDLPYPGLQLDVLDGDALVTEYTVVPEPGEGESEVSVRFSRLTGDAWTDPTPVALEQRDLPTRIVSVAATNPPLVPFLDGDDVRFLKGRARSAAQTEITIVGGPTIVRSEPLLLAEQVTDAVIIDTALVAVGWISTEPFDSFLAFDEPRNVFVFRSEPGLPDPAACELVAGGACQHADLRIHPDYPDFRGADLTGIDLAFAELGDADFSGADLADARLWGVAGNDANFSEATLSGAQLQAATIGSLDGADLGGTKIISASIRSAVGADFTGADLSNASIGDATDSTLFAATLAGAQLSYTTFPVREDFEPGQLDGAELTLSTPEGVAGEISLAGWDLTGVEISGPLVDTEPRLIIVDLTGATLSDTTFYAVDLSQLTATPDLSTVDVWDNSICPDGAPPTDGPIGTCVRSE